MAFALCLVQAGEQQLLLSLRQAQRSSQPVALCPRLRQLCLHLLLLRVLLLSLLLLRRWLRVPAGGGGRAGGSGGRRVRIAGPRSEWPRAVAVWRRQRRR